MITVQEKISLRDFSTICIGGVARYVWSFTREDELPALVGFLHEHADLPVLIVGDGSNSAYGEEVNKIIVRPFLLGKKVMVEKEKVSVTVGAGENWDQFVGWCVDNNYQGLEALSAIPGSVGAAPIQNIGAYGSEVGEYISEVKVFDLIEGSWRIFNKSECQFGYRDSFFKNGNPNRYIIVSVTFLLDLNSSESVVPIPDYPGVAEKLESMGITKDLVSLTSIRRAITEIRWSKLPKPEDLPNIGSFFKNPIVTKEVFAVLNKNYPEIPHWIVGEGYKLSAGWLIEQSGWKGNCLGPVCTYEKSALIVTNPDRAASFSDLLLFRDTIQSSVREKFGVNIEVEPNLIES